MERRSINRNSLSFLAVFLAFALVAPATAQAQRDDEIIDRVVVRNRKHSVWNTLEIAPSVGISLVNRMTQQYNFQLGIGFNFSEQWALDVRGGYALGGLTSVGEEARTRRQQFMAVEPVDEFQDLWRMTWQALVMPRWSPIYGKLNVVTELPIHFQAYLTAGGGMAGLEAESVVYCQAGNPDAIDCSGFLKEQRQSFVVAAGLGFRFFVTEGVGLRLELLDMMYPDQYRAGVDLRNARAEVEGSKPGEGTVTDSGLTNVLFFNIGATLNF